MAEEANSGDRVFVAFLVNTGFFLGEMVKHWSNIKHIKQCQLKLVNRAKIDQVKDHPKFGHIRIPFHKFNISSIKWQWKQ